MRGVEIFIPILFDVVKLVDFRFFFFLFVYVFALSVRY
jgi:hypothetical protein